MRTNRFRKPKSILSFILAVAMVMGLSGTTTLASELVDTSKVDDVVVSAFSATEDNQTLNVIEEAADEIAADATYTFHLYQITAKTGKIETMDDITAFEAGADLSYIIYDTETNEELDSGTTDESGSFELNADECAQFTLPAGTDWFVNQDTPDAYPLVSVTPDGDHASVVDSVNGVVQYEASDENPEPTSTVNKDALQAEYDADIVLNEDDYTPETWAPFKEALDKAKDVLDDPDATQEEVDKALEDLEKARKDLEKKDDGSNPEPTPEPDKVNITVTKTWDDNDDQDGKRPDNITVNLLADGSEVKEAAMAAGADGSWTYTFEGLSAKNDDGEEITYTVTEDQVSGYEEPQITGDAEEGFAITNSHTPETVSLTINKEWDDSDNQDGVRPDSITVGIFAGKTYVDSKEITEADGWSCTFDDLPVYENGEEIQYVAYEFADEPYYTGTAEWTEDTCLFTNSYTPEETGVSVVKVWDDADDQDGLRPGSVTVNLLADGQPVLDEENEPITGELNEDNDWSYDFTGLDKYADGVEIAYTVTEDEVDDYTAEDPIRIEGTNTFILVNTHEPALYNGDGNMTITKVWDDEDDSEGVRPDHIRVTVKADGEVVRQEYVTEEEDWTCTFTDLPQYADGQEIEYTVEEALPASVPEDTYTSEITEADGVFTITNTHAPLIDISVTKVWEDNNNQDGTRPDSVTVTLLKDEEETGQTLTLSEDNKWTDTFEGVSEYEGGKKITYKVVEDPVAGYDAAIDGNQDEGFTVTNTHVSGSVDITVNKEWADNGNADGTRPDEVTVHLWNADTETHLGSATLSEASGWTYVWEDQPQYANGTEICYEVTEEAVDGYDTDIAESEDEDGCPVFTITNTYAFGATIDITGTKVWDDADDQDGLRPDHVTIELLADETVVDSINITPYTTLTFAAPSPLAAFLAAGETNEWNFSFKDLPKYDESGNKITYTLKELEIEDYDSVITGGMTEGFTITNTHTPAKITVSGTKSWDDDDNRDGIRPNYVIVYLTIDGARVDDGTGNYESAVLTENGGWTYSFQNLDKCANGKAIDYGVEEEAVTGYEATYSSSTDADGNYTVDIANTHEPETVSYAVTKIWDDTDNQDGEQPTSVTVRLLANGAEVDHMNLTTNEDWTGTFTDLPKYEDGQEITYTVTEDPVADYTTTYSDPAFDTPSGTYSVTITNTHTPDEETLTINKVWADNGDQDGIRPDPEDFSVNVLHSDDDTNEVVATISGDDWTVAGDVWTATLDVDTYENGGEEIHYTVEEPEVPDGYAVTYGDADPLTIINTHTPETVDITVIKDWNDNDNQDGARHEVVTVRVYANGTEVASDNVAAVDDWTYTFTGLPKYENGTEITYTVTEDAMSDYSHEDIVLEAVGGGYEATITNTHTPGLTSVSVTKAWADGNDQDGLQPESVMVTLFADGAAVDTQDLSDANDWTYTFTDLPEYQNGSKVSYTVEEEAVGGYTSEITGDATAGYTITNYHTPETVDITGVKVWEDNDNQDGTRPDSITVTLCADGVPVTEHGVALTAVVDDEYGWHFAFTDLPKYDGKDGDEPHEIAYTIEEGGVPEGYDSTITGSVSEGFTITNTYETDTTVISGTKTWEDNNNQDGERPNSITVHLYANGEEIDSQELTEADAIDDNTWEYTFGEDDPLPTYKNGEKIIYTVFEDEVDDYVTTYDGYDITNTHEAGLTSVTVRKIWEDNDDQDGIRPNHITVELCADGVDMDTAGVLREDNDWSYTFDNLPVFDKGSRIQYAIAEIDEIDGYKVETVSVGTPVDEDYYYNYVIVNEHTPATTDVEVYKQWQDDDDAEGLRPDDVTITLTGTYTEDGTTETCYTEEALIDASDNWTAVFAEIPVYHEGCAIDYTVDEVALDGYESVITGNAEDGFTVTNTLTGEIDAIEVNKIWDEEDAYGNIPASVEVALFANGDPAIHTDGNAVEAITLTPDDWSGEFTDLPKYDENGAKIDYTVEETTEESLRFFTPEYTWNTDESVTITNYQKYFDLDEEIVPDEDDRTGWETQESVNAYNAIEIEMSTMLPDMSGEEMAAGEYSIVFHDELMSELVLDESAADFKLTIGGETVDSRYYTITLADGTSPARLTPFSITINDDCAFHVEVDLTSLYNDGVITDDDLTGDTEIMLYFFADLEGTDLNGSYTSTAWYEVYDGDEVQYTSDQHVVTVTTYEIEITKYDATDNAPLAGATLGVYYDEECASPVIRNGEPYTAVSDEEGTAVYYGLAEGIYYIQETEAPIGYQLSEEVLKVDLTSLGEDEYKFSGTYANEPLAPVDVTGTKTWDDNDDQDGMRPTEVTVNLMANDEPALDASGDAITATVTATDKIDDNTWSYSFTDLPQVTEDGTAITYTVTEDAVEEYETTIDGYDITNTHEPETIAITGEKVWDDNDNQDGVRPDFITIHLFADGNEIAKQTITEEDVQSFDFGTQPKYADGIEIEYTVSETVPSSLPDGTYTVSYASKATDDEIAFTVTNTHEPATTEIKGTKVWEDGGDQDGARPKEITVYLYATGANSTSVFKTTTDETKDWNWSFGEDLPVYDSGVAIEYTVLEEAVSDYNATYDYDMEEEGVIDVTITNTHTPGETSLTVVKYWNDEVDAAGFRPESITVNLLQDGQKYDSAELSEDNDWEYTFTNLPEKHHDAGEDAASYTYTVEEVSVDHYVTTGPERLGGTNAYSITNSYTPEETEVTVDKKWEDGDDQDGIRPASVKVSLLANDDVVKEATLDDSNNWAHTFAELPVYVDGKEMTYTVEETDVPAGYTSATEESEDADGYPVYTITNTHEPETIDISGTKVWLDGDNQDGKRPTDIIINLLADGVQIDSKDFRDPDVHPARLVTPLIKILRDSAEETEDWTWSFEGLPKYANGVEIVYTVEEEPVEGYESYIQGDMTTGFQIFNTHTPEQIDISVEKVWDDANDQDGLRPAYITVQLLNDGTVVDDRIIVADADGDWGCTFTADKYADGDEIAYEVNEILPESVAKGAYEEPVIEGSATEGFTITNTHTPKTISITIAKEWDDEGDQDGKRPDEITVGIFAGATWVDDATLTEDSNWAPVTFEGLPAYADGEKIQYMIYESEENLDGYTADADITTDAETGDVSCTITNTYTPEETGVMVTKVWDDGEDQDGKRPASVTVNLLADDEPALDENDEPITAELSDANDWTYNFTGLPDYEHGDEIAYSVEEVAVVDYDTEIIPIENANEFIIVNSYTPETIDVAVDKTWDDGEDQDGKRPAYITYRLLADGDEVDEWNAVASEDWAHTFAGVARYANGKEIDYTVTEDDVAEYTTTIDSSKDNSTGDYTVSVTNTYEPESTDMYVVKVWDDSDDQDGIRPTDVTVNLLADNEVIDTATLSDASDIDEDGNWTYTFDGLPVYADGEEITYTVTEDAVDGYECTVEESTDEDGCPVCTITNTHEPETIAIAGEKVWDDEGNQDGVRPDYIEVHLWADDEEAGRITITDSDVESDDDWTFDFGDLPVYADGNEITYTLTETLPASADGLYEEPVITPEETDDGIYFTVTNTHTPAIVTIKGTKVWDDGEDQDGERLESVPILLLADGQVAATTTADKEDAVDDDTWNWSFGEMPVYDDGTPIQYYVVEGEVTDYTPTYEYDMDAEGVFDVTITNTHTPDTTSLTVIKYWNDKDDESGFRPESIEIELLQDAAEYDTVELNEDNNWTYTFTDLPKKHDSGVEYTYSVEELTAISDVYTSTGPTLVEGSDSTYVFTNTYEPEETEVVVDKKWNDDNDRDRYRPESITATLLVNGTFDKEATLDEANNWAYTFGELPVYVNGEEATYTVEEVAVPNYDTETEYEETTNVDGLDITKVTITNTYVPETVELHGTKIWVDNDNQDSVRPDEVTVNILADGEPALDENGDPITVTLSAPKADEEGGNGGANFLRVLSTPLIRTLADDDETVENRWEWSIELPKYDGWEDDGVTRHEVVYTLDEVEVEGYESDIEGDMWSSFEIFNIHTPDTIDITGEKVWVDDNNSEGLRPAYITINLYKDDATEATASQTITAENEWNFAFTDLPTHENGEEINYTLTESMPTDVEYPYVSSGFEEVEGGSNVYTVTNTLSDETSITVDVDWDDGDNASETRPQDGIEVTLYANGDEVETVTLTGEDWTYTWDEMPVYDENGARITYTIEYGDIEGYDTETTYDEETDTFTIECTLIHSVDIYKYTEGDDNIAVRIDEDDPDANLDDEAFCFTATETGRYYIAYETSTGTSYHYLYNEGFAQSDLAENVYLITGGFSQATTKAVTAYIDVVEGETYFIHRTNGSASEYTGPKLCLIADANYTSSTVPTEHAIDFEVGYYEIEKVKIPLEDAQFVLTNADGEYGVFEDGTFVEWTENYDDATILTSAEDGYIHLTGLAAGSYSLIEVEAPYTYAPLEEPVEVTIGAADVTVDVDVENEPATTDVHINKEWDDNDDQDGMRTASVAVNLVKGENADAEVVDTAELSDANDWAYTFEGVPAYEDDEEIDYTVEEAEVPEGYECTIAEDTDEDGHLVYTLTNTHEPETIDIVIAKVWDDNDNQDGKRPDSLTVGLFADATWLGDAVLEPDGDGNWSTCTFEDLPVYANGVEIRYTAYEEEEELEGYTPDAEITTDGETVTCTITNSYTPGETSVTVTKVWEDEDNQDGHRPDSVTVNLMEGEEPVLDPETEEPITATLSEDNEWTDSFTGLPEYENGEKIEYTVTEDSVKNYDTEIIPIENSNEFIIVNSHTPETIEITGEKIWDDANDQDGVRPDYIDVDLMADGVVVDSLTVTDKYAVEGTDEDDTWAFDFGEQPKYNGIDASTGDVHEIVYTVVETMASSVEEGTYDTTIGDPVETDDGICFEITNTHTPETFTINGAKVWEDENDQDGARPTSVTLNLLADGEPALDESGDPIVVTVTDDTATDYNTWAWSIENLPVYKDGMEIQYHIVEDEVTGYTVTSDYEIEDTDVYDVTITNTHTPDETYVSVIKIWDDENDQDGKRPAELTIELLRADSADAEPEVVAGATLTLSDANNWSGTFENLPVKHHEAGEDAEEYVYSVQEVLDEDLGYTSDGPQQVGDTTTYTITNTYVPETTDFTVTKIWDDADDQDGCRPDSITVSLLANGAATDYMAQLSASDNTDENWTYTFTDLPVYANGEAIDYTVTETMPEDVKAGTYETEIKYDTGTVGDDVVINIGATITNTHEPETVTLYGTKIWVDNNDQDGYRPDEITVNILADDEQAYDDDGEPVTVTVSAPEEDGGNGASSPIRLLLTPLIQTLADDDETVESRWAWSISNLPKYGFDEDGNGGMEIRYTVSESMTLDENVPEDAYSISITGDAESGFEIFNIHETEQITITGEKIWDDEDDRDGVRPQYITINLSADGDAIASQTITADDIDENTGNWLFEFKDLDKYADGEEIEYTLTETMPDELLEEGIYTQSDFEEVEEGTYHYEVTNTHEPEKTSLTVNVAWDADEDYLGEYEPESVTAILYANGEMVVDDEDNPVTVTINEDGSWTGTFDDLYKYEDGEEINYTAVVGSYEPADYYTPEVTQNDDGSFTVTMHQMYFDFDEEGKSDADDTWSHQVSVNEYDAIEMEMSTYLPYMDGTEMEEGEYSLVFHDVLDEAMVLDEDTADFTVTIGGTAISSEYYTITFADDLADGCTFEVKVDLSALYNAGLITEEQLRGDTEIALYFYADLEGADFSEGKVYTSTAWYEVYKDSDLQYTSDKDVVEFTTYEFVVTKYDADELVSDMYARVPVEGATLGVYYDEACTEPVMRGGEPYTAVSGEDGLTTFYGLAQGIYYVQETEAPAGYELNTDVLTVDLTQLGDGVYKYDDASDLHYGNSRYHNVEIFKYEGEGTGEFITDREKEGEEDEAYGFYLEPGTYYIAYHTSSGTTMNYLTANGFEKSSEADNIYNMTNISAGSSSNCATIVAETEGWYFLHENGSLPNYAYVFYAIPQGTALAANDEYMGTVGFYEITGGTPIEGAKFILSNAAQTEYAIVEDGVLTDWTTDEAEATVLTTDEDGYIRISDIEPGDYYLTETEAAEGYQMLEEPYAMSIYTDIAENEVRVKNDPALIDITVNKKWDDADDQDGARPEDVTVNLLADGDPVDSITLSADEYGTDDANVWSGTFNDYPMVQDGEMIEYTVTEDEVDGYATGIGEAVQTDEGITYTITNTHEPETIAITGTKVWDDNENQDGMRPDVIRLQLIANEEPVEDAVVTIMEADDLTFDFGTQPKNANGEAITYTIEETMPGAAVEAYEMTLTSEKDADGNIAFTVKNTHTPETVDVEGNKTWDDSTNQDGKRPSEITIRLLANGEPALDANGDEITATVTLADSWEWRFTDLPKYKDGVEIVYTIAEDVVEGYETTINGYDVTNSYEPGKTSLNVQKIWDDADDQDGVRPNDITVELTKNGDPTGQTLTLDESSGWAGTFTDLDEYTGGMENTYSIAELDEVDGYTTTVAPVDETSTIVITNEHTPATIDIPVTKEWDDSDNQDGSRPENITFRVWNGNTMVADATIDTDEENETQSYTFEGLAKYEGGQEIAYVVTEDSVDNYSTEVTGSTENGFTVTNRHTPEQTSISVFKVWDDNDDQYELRPNGITVELLADGVETDETLTLDESNSWMGRFTVDKYEDGGTEIAYTVAEDQVDGYCEPVITGDASIGYIITNTLDTVRLHGTVIWVDDSDAYDVRPDEVTLAVYADEKPALDENDEPITVTVDATTTFSLFRPLIKILAADKNEWQWSSADLPKYNEDGTEIEYTVEEEEFENSEKYETYVEGDAENGFEVFNVYSESDKIILTLIDSTTGEPIQGGEFTLYEVVEDGEDKVVVGTYTTDENGQIIIEKPADGSYYFEQTAVSNSNIYEMPSNPKSETFTIPDDLDENNECEVIMENDPIYVVDYAVKIWGIGADTYSRDGGETMETAGLTFGPATGANYTNTYVSRETVGETAHPSEYCIHDMTWTEIIEQSKTDPKVFEDCKTNGCTKAVKLTPNDTLFNSSAVTATVNQNFTGDGVSTLHYELVTGSPTYALRWNYGTVTGTGGEELTYSNVYSRSRIRTMLTGDRTNIDNAVSEGSSSGIYYTASSPLADSGNCLLSCFPKALQDAIVPRATSNQGNGPYIHDNAAANDIETYDTLWLFSLTELGLSDNYNDSGGIDYEMISANSERVVYGLSDVNASATSAQQWWTRARYASGYTIAYDVNTSGAASHNNSVSNSVDGISPCFCLPGPGEEEEGYTGTVHYAVKLWGICTDTYSEDEGGTTGTASLTFGPALGGSYLDSSVSCASDTCIHKLEWAEIIDYCEQCQGDKAQLEELFGSCLENGCTKDVELTTNSTLFSSEAVQNAMDQEYEGDGVSTLSHLLKTEDSAQTGLFWNIADVGSSTSNPSNVYTHSRVRTSLNGDSANIMAQIAAGHTNFYYNDAHPLLTEKNCLFSCFPEELQSAIVPREVNASWTEINGGVSTDYKETTYDNLWLLSDAELGLTGTSDDGTDYGIVKSDEERVAYEYSGEDASSAAAQDWWTRSRSDSTQYDEHIVYKIQTDGTSTDAEPSYGNGISPAFCLK